jgi:hypothetical protein
MKMNETARGIPRDFVSWCDRIEVPYGSELSTLRDRAQAILGTPQPCPRVPFDDGCSHQELPPHNHHPDVAEFCDECQKTAW